MKITGFLQCMSNFNDKECNQYTNCCNHVLFLTILRQINLHQVVSME